jgi:hypothetical protein
MRLEGARGDDGPAARQSGEASGGVRGWWAAKDRRGGGRQQRGESESKTTSLNKCLAAAGSHPP